MKEYLNGTPSPLIEVVELDGVSVEMVTGEMRCVFAEPKSGGQGKIWLHYFRNASNQSWFWNAPLGDFNADVSLDPDAESRWEEE